MAVFLRYNLVFYGFVAQIPNTMIVLYLFLLKFIQTFKKSVSCKIFIQQRRFLLLLFSMWIRQ